MNHFQKRGIPTSLARLTALLGVALVLLLGVLSSSPELHERLHGHAASVAGVPHEDSQDSEAGCVVTLFSQGLVVALGAFALVLIQGIVIGDTAGAYESLFHQAPRYRLLPTQAPPAVRA